LIAIAYEANDWKVKALEAHYQATIKYLNRRFTDFLKANGADMTYEEGPGMYDWDFWDTYLQRVLEWLPIGKVSQSFITGDSR
jgi:S-formylglutathione hydrolase FrmB